MGNMVTVWLIVISASLPTSILGFFAAPQDTKKKDPAIHIVSASFGDQLSRKTCTPDLSLCEGITTCRFIVGDMCTVDSEVKNLEVTWNCGNATASKAKAAAKGTEISLDCGKQ